MKSFYLEPVDGKELATYLPRQFLTVRSPSGEVRNWSLSDWKGQDTLSYYRISVKKGKKASLWMHEQCTVGMILSIRSLAGTFTLDWTPMFPGR